MGPVINPAQPLTRAHTRARTHTHTQREREGEGKDKERDRRNWRGRHFCRVSKIFVQGVRDGPLDFGRMGRDTTHTHVHTHTQTVRQRSRGGEGT